MTAPARIILEGDSREALRALDPDSVDAVVCDPPYELGFMGRAWDASGVAFDPALWREVLRVLKPGGHLLAFGGTRTYHRIAVAIEDAGAEIRDSLSWLFGQGYPKNLNVSAALEKRRDDEAEVRIVCRFLRRAIDAHPVHTVKTIADAFGFHPRMIEHWAARDTDSQPTLPTPDQWTRLRGMLDTLAGDVDPLVEALNARKGEFGEDWHARDVTGVHKPDQVAAATYAITGRDKLRRDEPATDDGRKWLGWGTALKPGWEPIIVARKPLEGTVADNVLEFGTGAINVDGCRIPGEEVTTSRNVALGSSSGSIYGGADVPGEFTSHPGGRWPANVAVDDFAAAELDKQAPKVGAAAQAAGPTRSGAKGDARVFGDYAGTDDEAPFYGDKGGASRFYYCAKANRAEREAGLRELDPETIRVALGLLEVPRVRNVHPTVKPIALMRWLVRLVTPKGGRVLDPFTGSGSTACATALEGFDFVGMELIPIHAEIARRRLRYWERVALEAPLDLFANYGE